MLTSTAIAERNALIDEMTRIEGKAEIIHGEVVRLTSTCARPSYASGAIFVGLWNYVRRTGRGRAVQDNAGFLVDLPRRTSFSPDAAFFTGPDPGMHFFNGAPVFAVEVRSENDYGPTAEQMMAIDAIGARAGGWDEDSACPSNASQRYRSPAERGCPPFGGQ